MGAGLTPELALGRATRVNLNALFQILGEARKLSGLNDFVVIGSLSILALEADFDVPKDMTMSNDVDCYTRDDPDRIFELVGALGEHSKYHEKSGFYLDAVGPNLATLPEGWKDRLIKVERHALCAWFLDPNDAAVSKYARGEPRDVRWIRAGIRAGVVSVPVVQARMRSTTFIDNEEQRKAKTLADADRVWLKGLRVGKS